MNPNLSALLKPADSVSASEGVRQGTVRTSPSRARDWRSRAATALPWLMILGFLVMLAAVLGKRLLPATELDIATVVTVRPSVDDATSQATVAPPNSADAEKIEAANWADAPMLFQASGWVEPDPYATLATALVDGVVDTVEVLEGELVERGQVLAKLIDADARLDLETAKSQLVSLKAKATGHYRMIAILKARTASLMKQVAVAKARRDEAADLAQRLEKVSSGGVSERERSKAQLELATLNAEVEALAATEQELTAEIDQVHEVQIDYQARIDQAATEVARKQLTLERTTIVSPIAGRVLRLHAKPGQKKMLNIEADDSATVAVLYDPQQLQARIDVPLAEAAQLAVGQPVRLRSELLPGKVFSARVTRIVGEADLQRNTLQAKVAIKDPDERLRPDMLCRAEFLAAPATASAASTTQALDAAPASTGGRVQIFVPLAALVDADSDQTQGSVWKVDASGGHVALQVVTLGHEIRDDHRLVIDGLKPGDRVALSPPSDLETGERFRAAAADHSTNPLTPANS